MLNLGPWDYQEKMLKTEDIFYSKNFFCPQNTPSNLKTYFNKFHEAFKICAESIEKENEFLDTNPEKNIL